MELAANRIGDFLGRHYNRRIDVARWNTRKDRSIYNSEMVQTMDKPFIIRNRHVVRTHSTGACWMMLCVRHGSHPSDDFVIR